MKTKIFSDLLGVDSRLAQFGLTREPFYLTMRAMKMAWNTPTENFPNGSKGILSWMMGTSKVRDVLLPLGWERDTLGNVSWVFNRSLGVRIAILNADEAVCDQTNFPQPRSKKGAATESATAANLLSFKEILTATLNENKSEKNSGQWYFEVYCDGEEIRGELSLPTGFSNGNFTAYAERIFIGDDDGTPSGDGVRKHVPDSGDEYEIPVIRKKAV